MKYEDSAEAECVKDARRKAKEVSAESTRVEDDHGKSDENTCAVCKGQGKLLWEPCPLCTHDWQPDEEAFCVRARRPTVNE